MVLCARIALSFTKIKIKALITYIIDLVVVGLLVVAGILLFSTVKEFDPTRVYYPDPYDYYHYMDYYRLGAGWIIAAILFFIGGITTAVPVIVRFATKIMAKS